MKKLFSTLMLVLVALTVQAQILQPVKWKIQLNDSGSAEKEIVFTATADKGWHLYDQDLPEGGPVSTSFTFETLKGAELIGKPTSSVKPTTVYDELFAMNLRWYPGTVSFTQKFKVTDPAKFKAEGEVEFMACNDETCLPPDRVSFSFDKKNIKMTAATETVAEKPEVEQNDVTAVQPDTEKVVEEVAELKTTAPVADKDKAENKPTRVSNELTDDAALWTPVIDKLKAFGDTTVSATDIVVVYLPRRFLRWIDRPADTLCMADDPDDGQLLPQTDERPQESDPRRGDIRTFNHCDLSGNGIADYGYIRSKRIERLVDECNLQHHILPAVSSLRHLFLRGVRNGIALFLDE